MKKLLAVSIAAVMMTGLLAGCGAKETTVQDTTAQEDTRQDTTAQEDTTQAEETQNDSEQADASAEGRTFTVGFEQKKYNEKRLTR